MKNQKTLSFQRKEALNKAKPNIYELFSDAMCILHNVWNIIGNCPVRALYKLSRQVSNPKFSDLRQQTFIIVH